MTIGIGVLGSAKRKPDHIILVSDTMGSYEDVYSTSELHKAWHFPKLDLYAVGSGSIDLAAEYISTLHGMMKQLPEARSYGDVIKTITNSFHGYKTDRFAMALGPELMFTRDEWFDVMDPTFRATILQQWTAFDVGFDLVIGSFAHNGEYDGQAFLVYISGQEGKVKPVSLPGVCAIGTGQENANFWLAYRQHKLGCSVKRAAYHAYEAKLMAEKSPYVNERVEMVIASAHGRHFALGRDRKKIKGCPVSLPELEKLYRKYGPQSTSNLDPSGQAAKMVY